MKKILKTIKNFFQKVIKTIDKVIVIPISKFVLSITKRIGNSGKAIEVWLSKTNTLLFISLFMAVLLFVFIDQAVIKYSQSTAELFESQLVTVKYNSELYVVEGVPETVDITLIGGKIDLFIAKQMPSPEILIDLTDLGVGKHEVQVKYNQSVGNLKYMINPSTVTVEIFDKLTETISVTTDILNQDSLDKKLIVESVVLEDDKVVVKGAEHKLAQVATVRALVDLKELQNQGEGEYTLENVILKAYDTSGEVVDVEIVPTKLNAKVTIKSSERTLAVKVVPKGEVVFGKAISSIETSVSEVTVYGPSDILEQLSAIEVEIDVQDLKDNKTYKVDLSKPTGVKSMSETTLTVTVRLDSVSSRDIENVKVDFNNIESGYIANAVSTSDETIAVNIQGVKSVIDRITSEDITAYADLKGKGPGTYDVEVYVTGSDSRVTYTSLKKTVRVIITKKNN